MKLILSKVPAEKQYLLMIRKCFPSYGSYEKQYFKHFQRHLRDYLIDFPDSTCSDLLKEFGTPEEFLDDYVHLIRHDFYQEKSCFSKKHRFFFLF